MGICHAHRIAPSRSFLGIAGEWRLSNSSTARNGHAALSGAFKFEAELPPLNFGAG
jgi:hypothetical protein